VGGPDFEYCWQVYCDDFDTAGIVVDPPPNCQAARSSPLTLLHQQARTLNDAAGVPTSRHKFVIRSPCARRLGMWIDGKWGMLSLPGDDVVQLMRAYQPAWGTSPGWPPVPCSSASSGVK
jgi:hypothetical protein